VSRGNETELLVSTFLIPHTCDHCDRFP